MNVPMIDLPAQFRKIRQDVLAELIGVFDSQYFVLGPRVKKIEEEMATLAGVPHAIGVSSGTDALILSLLAIGIMPGDEVVTTPYTFFSTASAIVRVGGIPIFADVEEDSFNLDIRKVDEALTERTRAVLPVHLFGLLVEPEPWKSIAQRNGLYLIEDACQAVGARRNGYVAGGIGDLACFSFYPTKNLGGAGDGGMVLVRDDKLAVRVRMDRVHGGRDRYYYDRVGICGRLDEVQAAVLIVKFRHLAAWNEHRRTMAAHYDERLKSLPVKTPVSPPGAYHTYHQYVILAPKRNELREFLKNRGIGCDVYYPVPLHLQNCFASLGYRRGQFPISERLAQESLALPMSAELSEAQVDVVVSALQDFYGSGGA